MHRLALSPRRGEVKSCNLIRSHLHVLVIHPLAEALSQCLRLVLKVLQARINATVHVCL